MLEANKINYVEFPSKDLAATKTFFTTVFGWSFQDFGPEYTAFSNEGLDGGFFKSELTSSSEKGAALVVLFSSDLEATLAEVKNGGGIISKEIFSFPGGRRFHFTEPGGSELAVWSNAGLEQSS
ncbi:VOC family protein [Thalassomonas viridans]|uniref:VOC family protein n=1 Tax=Thalassomonas viridans TaxID=137584 RepID=A0AAE9Z9C1_9GAMM|nr:VOC family protein [Thalassomonas viridans]WDE09145.1 VOC family protein [Thalassomonas viridans]